MNALEQLAKLSSIVADSGDIEAIKRFTPIDATTNPSLLLKASELEQYQHLLAQARDYGAKTASNLQASQLAADKFATLIGKEISQIVSGYVSTEIDARLSFDSKACIERARQIIALYDDIGVSKTRILIKIAATWEGIQAAKVLEKEGIQCNITLLFCEQQAQAAADVGAFLISPFVGRITDWYKQHDNVTSYSANEDPGVLSVQKIYSLYKSQGYKTVVMAASFRNTEQILALAGCDKLTISPELLAQLSQDTRTVNAVLKANMPAADFAAEAETASSFRFAVNQNLMAYDKLGQGIRAFIADQVSLEKKLGG